MASQSPNPQTQDNAAAGNEPSDKLVFEVPQPMREDQVQNAVKFLSHPKVQGSPVFYRRSFLEKKGLTKEEIDEAFRRVPDPQPTATNVGAAGAHQATNPNQSTGLQSRTSVQTLQPTGAPVTASPMALTRVPRRFRWFHALLAAGLLLGCGAGAVVFFKKILVPRMKAWIRRVVAEGDESEKDNKLKSKVAEETAEAVKATASAAAAISKTNQELLSAKDEEKKILQDLASALNIQAKEFKSMSETMRKNEVRREDRFSQDRLFEEHHPSTPRNGPVNNSWRASQQANMYGSSNGDFGSVRPSFAGPVSAEATPAAFSRPYAETMSTGQRGEKPSGSRPWDMPPYSQQRPGYSYPASDDGSNFETQENHGPPYPLSSKTNDALEPWWMKKAVKITEVDAEAERRPSLHGSSVPDESPFQRRWVPPQPPSVAMPEAAAAIRQPKSSTPKNSSVDGRMAAGVDDRGDGAPRAYEAVAEVQNNGVPTVASEAVPGVQTNGNAVMNMDCGETEERSDAVEAS